MTYHTTMCDLLEDKDPSTLTFEDIMEILEDALTVEDPNNPYKPLNFHDEDESY